MPLLVSQPQSRQVEQWVGEDDALAVWMLTPVELTSAIRRLVRERALNERDAAMVESRIDDLMRVSHVVVDVEGVRTQARRLLRLHSLRSADALQLAAALEWTGGRTAGRTLVSLDAQLTAAALREGFHVVPDPYG